MYFCLNFAFMRFIVFLVFLFSVQSFSQVKRINEKMSTDNAQKVQSSAVTSSLDRFSSVSLSDNDSLSIKKVITKAGDTIAPISEYKIINDKLGLTTFDIILNIKKQYAFNYLRKDIFGLLPFNNDGQTYQSLKPTFSSYNNTINMGFNARRFTYLNAEDISYYSVPTPASELLYRSVTGKGQNLDALITINTSEQFNLFLGYRGMRSQGKYVNQLTSNGNLELVLLTLQEINVIS